MCWLHCANVSYIFHGSVTSLFFSVGSGEPNPRDAPWNNKAKEVGIPTLLRCTKPEKYQLNNFILFLYNFTEFIHICCGTRSVVSKFFFIFCGLHPVASMITLFGGAVNRNGIFRMFLIFYKYIFMYIYISPEEICKIYVYIIKTFEKILLRLTEPPKILIYIECGKLASFFTLHLPFKKGS
jgi:hypothetical protein